VTAARLASQALQPAAPQVAGIGLRHPHHAQLLRERPALAFVEVHAENFFGAGGAARALLADVQQHWPVSLHGVGLSLGSACGLDLQHLDQLADLVDRTQPLLVSDHACFCRAPLQAGGPVVHANDLLPIAFTDVSLATLVAHVQQVQDRLKRPICVENLSAYLRWPGNTYTEPEFFNALTRRSGCSVLLDVNNLVVNALNDGCTEAQALQQANAWVSALRPGSVAEIHLAGYDASGELVIDDHGSRVHPPVWQVYAHAVRTLGPLPTLVEWDTQLPPLHVLLQEAAQAQAVVDMHRAAPHPAP
jgi:uncharacterized protein